MEEWDRRPLEEAAIWLARLQTIRLPPTATRTERARLAAVRRNARLAVRRAIASERLRQVFQVQPEAVPPPGRLLSAPQEGSLEDQATPALFQPGSRQTG